MTSWLKGTKTPGKDASCSPRKPLCKQEDMHGIFRSH